MAKAAGQIIHVSQELGGKTLGAVLKQKLRVSWGEAEMRVFERRVAVHGNLCLDPARRLKTGDVVNLLDTPAAKPKEAKDLDIVYQDRDVVVVDKPAGIVSVREPRESKMSRERRERQPTLDELLTKRLSRPHDRGKTIFPVHRLDRDTSGLMIFARNAGAERELIRRFQAHDIDRVYAAVTRNGPPPRRTANTLIVRDRGDGKRGSLKPGQSDERAQRAITHVQPSGNIGELGLVECRLETGRTHQIRIHLSELGHPICGDKLYGSGKEADPPPRQALHARFLGFAHPKTGQPLFFERDWPADLADWLYPNRRR
ncbi:MAG: RluA family pseudouridine synthase [Planctomycetota bacterium]